MAPLAELSQIAKADGSASFAHEGYSITAVVNGPVEAGRRDENAFEAVIDVNVRPSAGVGGTAERQLEAILESALKFLVPVKNFPRCVIQVTLQVMETPENSYINTKLAQPRLNLGIIPPLLHAAILGLLTAAIPLKKIASAVTIALKGEDSDGSIKLDPSPVEIDQAKSVHVFAFTSDDELLVAESEGSFDIDEWQKVLETARHACCQIPEPGVDTVTKRPSQESENIKAFIRSVMETETAKDLHWR